MIVLFDYSSSD